MSKLKNHRSKFQNKIIIIIFIQNIIIIIVIISLSVTIECPAGSGDVLCVTWLCGAKPC